MTALERQSCALSAGAAGGLYEKIFRFSNDAIFIMDPMRDRFVDANPKACERLGYSYEELLALPISAVHPNEMPELLAFARSVFALGHGWTSEFSCLTKAGDRLPSEVSASFIELNGQHHLVAMVRDITDRKRAEEALRQLTATLEQQVEERTTMLRRSEERQRALLAVGHAILANLDRAALFESIAHALRVILPFDIAVLCLLDEHGSKFRLIALEKPALAQPAFDLGAEIPLAGTHVAWVIERREPLRRDDLAGGCRFAIEKQLLATGLRSYVAAPLVGRQAAFGSLNIGCNTPARYSEEDAQFFADFAKQVALAVENMLAYEEIVRLKASLEGENVYLKEELRSQHNFEEIVGQSAAIRKVLTAVETVAATNAGVLILGETGTGKELIARAVHNLSGRKDHALIKVNCAAIPTGLVESELFGHERGAFTGALAQKIGRFERADKGTIFLDEIGELPLDLQAKLLRVLQEGEFERVGGSRTITVDARVIAATNRDLEAAVAAGRFREDLYYRLNVFPIELPSLRERREDIPLLAHYFVRKHAKRIGKKFNAVPRNFMDTLKSYPWPGNIRELENVIERAIISSREPRLALTDAFAQRSAAPHKHSFSTLNDIERQHIAETLKLTNGRVSGDHGAAKILGLKPTTLESRMKKLGMTRTG